MRTANPEPKLTYSELVDKAASICEIGKPFPKAQLLEEAFLITEASAPKNSEVVP